MPSIALPSTAGRTVDLAAEAQTHHLVVFFYPGDEDASRYHVVDFYSKGPYAFRDSLDAFHSLGAEVFGVSLQRTERQRQFAEREQLSFELLSDSSERFTHEVGIPIWVSETGERFAASGVLIIRRGGEIADVLSHFVVQGQLEKVPLEKVVEAVRRLE
jgi:peroxiredoxin